MTNATQAGLTPLTIFVACAGDCAAEREVVHEISRDLEDLANNRGVTLKVRDWTQVAPSAGRPQGVIFDQLPVQAWDVFVGVLWLRFGSRSGGANAITGEPALSGTEEEFTWALDSFKRNNKPRILFYRRTSGPPDVSKLDATQLTLVQEFFKQFETGNIYEGLYKTFAETNEFRSLLRRHLQAFLLEIGGGAAAQNAESNAVAVRPSSRFRPEVRNAWANRLLSSYDAVKLHRISSAYDAGTVLRSDRDRVRLHDIFVPQYVCDVSKYVTERLPAPRDLLDANEAEIRLLGIQHHNELRKAKRWKINELLNNIEDPHVVLLGDPGAGKSSLLQFRALSWAKDPGIIEPMPILLEMRQYAGRVNEAKEQQKAAPSLLSWAGEVLAASAGIDVIDEEELRQALSTGEAMLYCDALDEIFDAELRQSTAEQILKLSIKLPMTQIVVTSRPVGYPDEVFCRGGFAHWMVMDFNRTQIREFITKWVLVALPDPDDRLNVTERLNEALDIPRVKEMAGNPLLLTLMSILARTDELPRDRIRLYSKAAELLLYQWDTSRSLRPIRGLDFAYEQKHRVLRELAWRMQSAQLGLGGNLASHEMVKTVFDEELRADLERPGDRGLPPKIDPLAMRVLVGGWC